MSKSYTSQMCIDPGAEKIYYGRTNHGGHAERIAVRETACVPMPDGLSYEEGAACACGTGTAYDALKRLDLSGRDTFAIYGQGPVGLSAALFGVATGARVIVVEPVAYRRELAKSLGCDAAIDHKQLTIHGSWTMSTIGLGEVARYVAERKLPLKKLITHHFRLEQAA
ncbi:MAG: hypothetical protein Q7W38_11455, partial [Deltaproteobacteria bacterium]|nr:hypothetical protein [Deltaproteobacteria bacterium]